jgi:hypothetical protein
MMHPVMHPGLYFSMCSALLQVFTFQTPQQTTYQLH